MQSRKESLKRDIERLKHSLDSLEYTLGELDKDNKRDHAKVTKCIKDKLETEILYNNLYLLWEEECRSSDGSADTSKSEYDRKSKTYSIIRNSYRKLTDN